MGQYYKIIAKNTETNEVFYNARVLKGYQKYINEMKKKHPKMYWDTHFGAKLMEHSWNSCHLMTSVASMLKKGKFRLIWCGDYAEDDEIKDISNGEADYDMLWRGTWCISPIPLMTAVGNGRGGGDYDGVNFDKVGSWAWDEVSIGKKISDDYKKLDIYFKYE